MADSVVAPTTTSFSAGHDVVGLAVNTALPTELKNWVPFPLSRPNAKPVSAVVTYNSGWNPSSTDPMVKYNFIAFVPIETMGYLVWGIAICDNPSVSTTAKISGQFQVLAGTDDGYAEYKPYYEFGRLDFDARTDFGPAVHASIREDDDGNGFLDVYGQETTVHVKTAFDVGTDGEENGTIYTSGITGFMGG